MFGKLKRKDKKIADQVTKDIEPIIEYLKSFNSPLAPRGESARYQASKEFIEKCIKFELKAINSDYISYYFSGIMTLISLIGLTYTDCLEMSDELLNELMTEFDLFGVDYDN